MTPYRITKGRSGIGSYAVVDRETGRHVGAVERRPEFGIVLWTARDAENRKIDGPCSANRYPTRAAAAAAVWAGRDIDGLAADDVLADQAAGIEMLDAALDDDAALVAQFNDTGSA